jgi:predicted ATPase
LDGIPLAIELAAAWIPTLPPAQIESRLNNRFRFLTRGAPRTALPHHQTLQATIDWSYDLLGDREKTLLRRLAVFRGGWTLEAAEAICSDEARLCVPDILDSLSSLIAKSLVLPDDGGHGASAQPPRYHFLETVRQYAEGLLHKDGEAHSVRERHQQFFRELAEQAEPNLQGPDQQRWFDRLEAEHDNLRAALAWSGARADARARLAAALFWFWRVHGYFAEGRAHLENVLAGEHPRDVSSDASSSQGAEDADGGRRPARQTAQRRGHPGLVRERLRHGGAALCGKPGPVPATRPERLRRQLLEQPGNCIEPAKRARACARVL